MTQQHSNGGASGSPLIRYGAIGAGIVAIVALAGWCATFAFQDDSDDGTPAGGDSTPTALASPTAATATAAPTSAGSPTASPSPAASPTAATATAATSPSPTTAATATTAPATATATRPPATTAPTSAPTAPPTATATATTAPTNTPTATATPTTAPTATPTPTPTTAPITNFAGTWYSSGTCDNPPYYRWTVSLSQQGANVSGSIHFHACPGGGQAAYSVSGTATSAGTVQLAGPKVVNLGGLGSSTPGQATFTIAPFGPPSPNYAP